MAINATHVAGLVRRTQKIAVLLAILMAGETAAGDIFGGDAAKGEDFCGIAGRGVLATGPVATLAGVPFPHRLCAERDLAMRRGIEAGVGIGVAFFALRGADVVGGLRAGGCEHAHAQ